MKISTRQGLLFMAMVNMTLVLSRADGEFSPHWFESTLALLFVAVSWIAFIDESNVE